MTMKFFRCGVVVLVVDEACVQNGNDLAMARVKPNITIPQIGYSASPSQRLYRIVSIKELEIDDSKILQMLGGGQ